MKTMTDSQLSEMLEDIASIKKVLSKSKPSIQLLFLPIHFRVVFLLTGIFLMAFAGMYHYLVSTFQNFETVPTQYKYLFIGGIAFFSLTTGFLKNRNWLKSLAKINPDYDFVKAYREFFTFKIMHIYVMLSGTMILFILYWIYIGQLYFIIPTICIGIGILGNVTGNMTDVKEYSIMGVWNLICGFIIIFHGAIPGALAISFSLGLGFILFSLLSYLTKNPGAGKSE